MIFNENSHLQIINPFVICKRWLDLNYLSKYFYLTIFALFIMLGCADKQSNHSVVNENKIHQDATSTSITEEDPLEGYDMENDFKGDNLCKSFYYDENYELFIGLINDQEALFYFEGIVTRLNYTRINEDITLYDHRDTEIGKFNIKSGKYVDNFIIGDWFLEPCLNFDESQKIVPLRLLVLNPDLPWYDNDYQFTLSVVKDKSLYAVEVIHMIHYISTNSALYLHSELRSMWFNEWKCAFDLEPDYIKQWLEDVKIDMMAKILYTGTQQASFEIDQQINEKIKTLLSRYSSCLSHVKAYIDKYGNNN